MQCFNGVEWAVTKLFTHTLQKYVMMILLAVAARLVQSFEHTYSMLYITPLN